MTETPAAAAAAPAAPAAPAPAPAPAPAAPAAATPPAASAAPAAAAPPAASAADEADDSLLPADAPAPAAAPQTPEEKIAAAKKVLADAEAAADPNGRNPDGTKTAWLLTEGVMGVGEKPGWFKADKYKNVAEQAKAYAELEPRFGAFVGAPKDGVYKFTPPEGVEVQMDHPLMQEFTKWAKDSQLSQDGYTSMLNMLVQYEAAHAPNLAEIKANLGENADTRIAAVAAWGKANLGNDGYQTLRAATSGKNADAVFKVLEAVIAKTGQVRMPKPGDDVPGAQAGAGLEAIKADHGKKDAKGGLLVNSDPKYRAEIERRYREYFAGAQ